MSHKELSNEYKQLFENVLLCSENSSEWNEFKEAKQNLDVFVMSLIAKAAE